MGRIFKELESWAKSYEQAHLASKEIDAQKKQARTEVGKRMDEAGWEPDQKYDFDVQDGKALRVQKIQKRSVKYDEDKMLKLLKGKGKDAFKKAVKISIDQAEIENLYNSGVLSFEELEGCVDAINETELVDIRRVKADQFKESL